MLSYPSGGRARLLAEAFAPGAVVSEVARRFEDSTGLIYTWRRQALVQEADPAFVPAELPPFRPDSRHKQKGSSTGLRTGLCLTSIDTLNC
ncbi:transposase [Ensifer sp. PDNC004]|uniref:transposase n=1 Tax=Ensifer sp. PDNC004 TaxID=2811423 RepID=UPI00352FF771